MLRFAIMLSVSIFIRSTQQYQFKVLVELWNLH